VDIEKGKMSVERPEQNEDREIAEDFTSAAPKQVEKGSKALVRNVALRVNTRVGLVDYSRGISDLRRRVRR